MKTYTLTKAGNAYVRGFLTQTHSRGFDFTEDQIELWGMDACYEKSKGNQPRIVVSKYESYIGEECSTVIPLIYIV